MLTATLLLLTLVASGCGNKSDVVVAREDAGTVNGLCPVREQEVVEGYSLVYDGQKIGFCCFPCKETFLKKPEEFVARMRANREKFGYVGK